MERKKKCMTDKSGCGEIDNSGEKERRGGGMSDYLPLNDWLYVLKQTQQMHAGLLLPVSGSRVWGNLSGRL